MSGLGYVNDGTASVTNGTKIVTFTDVSVALFVAKNEFCQNGLKGLIASVDTDGNTVTLLNDWAGDTTVDQPYYVITIPESSELAETTRRWNQYLNGPILSIAEMMGDDAPAAGDTLVWDSITGTWLNSTPAASLLNLLNSLSEVSIASASTCDIGAATSPKVQITGTTAITGLGSQAGAVRFVRFAAALTLTHNAASLILPGAANIITAAGDTAIFASDGSGNWRCLAFQRAHGGAPVATGVTGSGKQVMSAGPTLTGTVITAAGSDECVLAGTTTPGGWSGNARIAAVAGSATALSGQVTGTTGNAVLSRVDDISGFLFRGFYQVTEVGSIKTNGTTTSYNTSSDARLKSGIEDAPDAGAVIDALKVRQWDWKSNGVHEPYGFVAQEEYQVYAPAVTPGDDDPDTITRQWGRDDSKLVPLLVKEIQSLRRRLEALEGQ